MNDAGVVTQRTLKYYGILRTMSKLLHRYCTSWLTSGSSIVESYTWKSSERLISAYTIAPEESANRRSRRNSRSSSLSGLISVMQHWNLSISSVR